MTDSRSPRADDQQDGDPGDRADETLLTTGEAAHVIGYGTTRKRVITMIAEGTIAHVRTRPGAWARIPLSAALAVRDELEAALAESEAAARQRQQKEREERARQEAEES